MASPEMTSPDRPSPDRQLPDWHVLVARPDALARIVAGALESEGIPVRLSRDGFGTVYGLQHGRFATRVLVAGEDLVQARALLAEIEASEV